MCDDQIRSYLGEPWWKAGANKLVFAATGTDRTPGNWTELLGCFVGLAFLLFQ